MTAATASRIGDSRELSLAVRDILQLGNSRLYEVSEPVLQSELDAMQSVVADLHDTMMDFRQRYGAGRAIAAPQIGVKKRLIYMHIDKPTVFINPVLDDKSEEMIEVWDDCMCFPNLLVRVRRHKTCLITYRDLEWNECALPLTDDLSELLQHEYDHLDGVLAVSRAIDERAFALRNERISLRG
jgi:peptide deformylase